MNADRRFPQTPLNGCGACHVDFTSTRLFDAHRVGVHAYDFNPERPDGRRCLSSLEMSERGWEQDEKSRWFDPVAAEAARMAFRAAPSAANGLGGSGRGSDDPEAGIAP